MLSEADSTATPLPTLRALAANIKTKGADQFQHNAANPGRVYVVPKGDK